MSYKFSIEEGHTFIRDSTKRVRERSLTDSIFSPLTLTLLTPVCFKANYFFKMHSHTHRERERERDR